MHPLLRLIAGHVSVPSTTPFPMSEIDWSNKQDQLASLKKKPPPKHRKVGFCLDNLQTGFPIMPIPLIASLLMLIQKGQSQAIPKRCNCKSSMNTRVQYILSFFILSEQKHSEEERLIVT